MDRLKVVPPYGSSFLYPMASSPIVIGRSTAVDLHIADRFMSRRHARLLAEQDLWLVEDLGSRNGSWLNGRRIDRPTRISSGDRIRLSNSYLLYEVPSDEQEKTPSDFISEDSDALYRPASEISTDLSRGRAGSPDSPGATAAHFDYLRLLNRLHASLNEPHDLEGLLEVLLDQVFDTLKADQAVVYLRDQQGDFQRAAERSIASLASQHLESRTLLERVGAQGLTALVRGLDSDPDWQHADSMLEQGVRSLIAAPLTDDEQPLGMIALTSRADVPQFDDADLDLLLSIASVASLRVRNILLTEDALRQSLQQEQYEQELDFARNIQVGLLPEALPTFKSIELFGSSMPCRHVSGDYYKFVSRREGEEALVMLSDVAGKGLGASLLTASVEALASGPVEVGQPPGEICSRVSRRLFERTTSGRFATMFVASISDKRRDFTYASAGHCPALLIRQSGKVDTLPSTGPPLGLLAGAGFSQSRHRLSPEDVLLAYTDGLTEAEDDQEQEYGIERLIRVARDHRHLSLQELAKAIEVDIEQFVQGHPYEDDRTLVIIRRIV